MALEFFELSALAPTTAGVGGKARGLAGLFGAGLPVPRGVVAIAGTDLAALARAARSLRAPLVVRSSANVEDGRRAAAPGIFASERDVGHDALVDAARRVVASATSATAASYLAARGIDAPVAMAVIVQEQIRAVAAGTVFTRAPHDPAAVLVETHEPVRVAAAARDGGAWELDPDFPLDRATLAELGRLARAAEHAIDAAASGADVEWVFDGDRLWLVQARPIVAARAAAPAPAAWFAALSPGRWYLDASHNPAPLSPAQASLVERVDRAGLAAAPMRVVGRHLYVRDQPGAAVAIAPAALADYFDRVAAPAMEAILGPAEADPALSIEGALAAHDAVYRIYARELAPRVSAARRELADALAAPMPAAGFARWLAAAARGEIDRAALVRAIGWASPAWDVACPTFAEDPAALDAALAAPPRPAVAADPTAVAVHRVSEEDDLLYARAQWLVRRALLRRAAELGLERPAAIFEVAIEDAAAASAEAIVAAAEGEPPPPVVMPLVVEDGAPRRAPMPRGEVLRGRGTGTRVRGPVFRLRDHRASAPPGSIAVAETLTPAAALAVRSAAAIVCEHGGLLGHAAATARELGIPCVVGCRGVWAAVVDGEPVTVDGDRGWVVLERADAGD